MMQEASFGRPFFRLTAANSLHRLTLAASRATTPPNPVFSCAAARCRSPALASPACRCKA
ncbi:hypothetical protein PSEUDO8AS_50229 [Pseudomonas sp. 8AS]|nr:hypothetical protein PSEUDO8AS_50229 [Pseudomonas sp. 8AS]